jgi:3-oxoacyl-[acyl-carrier-protein] synthase II
MERVVITGLGLVTPCGMGAEPTLQNLLDGKSGVGPITQFEATEEFATRFAAEVKGFEPSEWMAKKKLKETSRFITFAVAATRMALDHAEVALTDEERERTGCFIGVGLGGLENLEKITLTVHQKSPRKASPYSLPSIIGNLAAGQVSIEFGLHGPSYCHTSACASGAHAIGEAFNWIQLGQADVMVAGGAEATVTPVGVAGFSAMFALSRRNDTPERASRPFDRGRDGFVLGEGAGILVLESLTRARRRGANILAELTGWGATTDAHHLTRPPQDHPYAAKAMRLALCNARLAPEQIGYINAHGTSTPMGDVEESRAIARLFGAHATDRKLWVSSTKSMMGHLLGASGAVEAAVAINAVRTGAVPPTINLEEPDPECTLDYVPNHGRQGDFRHAMSNSFGFGGTNVALVMSRFDA